MSVLPGSENQAKAHGSSRNLGGPVVSTRISGWSYRTNNSWPSQPRSAAVGAKSERTTWYGQAKATKRGPKDDRASEHFIVAMKPGNSTRGNPVERRECRVGEPLEGNMAGASKSGTVSTKQQRIVELAKQAPPMSFTSLAYFMDIDWLAEAYRRTRKDGAGAVDGQASEQLSPAGRLRGKWVPRVFFGLRQPAMVHRGSTRLAK